jgi:hypothetical protein
MNSFITTPAITARNSPKSTSASPPSSLACGTAAPAVPHGDNAKEITSVRMVGGTFALTTQGVRPDDRDLRPLTSGSFPLAFMIGNEFVVHNSGVRFATAWLQPYHDVNGNGQYDHLFDEWFFRAPPELTDPFGYFNIVYVTDDVEIRTTPATFQLRRGWNLVVARLVGTGLQYSVEPAVEDVVMYSYGTNMTFEDIERQNETNEPTAPGD